LNHRGWRDSLRPFLFYGTRQYQRGRGRSGGRAVSGRGRMRKRGPSGGGTLRRRSPQQGQWPSFAVGAVRSARIQWPRASQSGLMHCTVKPGKYCIFLPRRPQCSGRFMCERATVNRSAVAREKLPRPLAAHAPPRSNTRRPAVKRPLLQHLLGTRGNNATDGADSAARKLWCQAKRLQDIVVRLRGCGKPEFRTHPGDSPPLKLSRDETGRGRISAGNQGWPRYVVTSDGAAALLLKFRAARRR